MVVQDLVVAWEDAYRRYEVATEDDVTDASRAVADAWHELAAYAELPWWLSAAVRSAAQAFEHQAEDWAPGRTRHVAIAVGSDETEENDEEGAASRNVVLPAQQGPRKSCACHQTPSTAGNPAAAAPVVRVPA